MFCALAYSRRQDPHVLSLENVIVVLLAGKENEFEIRVRPDWKGIVESNDQEYIRELFDDFKARSLKHSENLFKQASGLSAGPLLTYAIGAGLEDHHELLLLLNNFEKV